MQPSFAVLVLWVVCIVYVMLIYLHAFFDKSFTTSTNLTISGQTDDPERQLVAILVVSMMAYTVTNLFFDNGLHNVSNLVTVFLILMFVLLFGTILVRLSWSPSLHLMLAGLTFFAIVGLVIALAPHTKPYYVSMTIVFIVVLVFLPALQVRLNQGPSVAMDRMMALAELVSIVGVAVQMYLFFRTNVVK